MTDPHKMSVTDLFKYVIDDVSQVLQEVEVMSAALQLYHERHPGRGGTVSCLISNLTTITCLYAAYTRPLPQEQGAWAAYGKSDRRFWEPTIRNSLLLRLQHGQRMRQTLAQMRDVLAE